MDFSTIFQWLRKPTRMIATIKKYDIGVEQLLSKFKAFIIRLFRKEVDFSFELGTVSELIFLIQQNQQLIQWYLGTVLLFTFL